MEYRYIDTGKTSRKKKHDDVTLSKSFVQLYSGVFKLFARISSPCAKNLFIWSIENSDRWNTINLGKSGRASFVADMITTASEKYADSTVKNAIYLLVDEGIMVSTSYDGKRGASYMINPYYVWKTKSKTDRYEIVKAYINILKDNEGN